MRILYLVPDLFGTHGGIARHSRLVCKALCGSDSVDRLDIVALWDIPGQRVDARYVFGDRCTYTACAGSRLSFASAVLRAMAQRSYHILLSAHLGLAPLTFSPLPNQRRSKRVTFIHGVDAWPRLPLAKRWALRASDMVLAVSQHTADRAAAANGLKRTRLKLLHNCLDPSLPEGGQSLDDASLSWVPSSPARVLVTISRLASDEDKGHRAILLALPGVLEQVPDVHYLIIGDGDLRPALEKLASDLGVSDRTHFLGAVSDAAAARALACSDVYVMPGRNEGFGFVFLEAMAHHLPIIAGIHDAAPEVLGSEAGVLVDADDIQQVTTAVVRVLSDTCFRDQLIEGGQRRLDELFRYPRFEATLLSQLEELVGAPREME